jgi:hypothetical protein
MHKANYIVLGLELPSSRTGSTITSVTNDLPVASIMPTSSNLTQTGIITNESSSLNSNITNESSSLNSNITNESSSLNSNITNESSSLNTTMPEQLPPQSINGSKVPKI